MNWDTYLTNVNNVNPQTTLVLNRPEDFLYWWLQIITFVTVTLGTIGMSYAGYKYGTSSGNPIEGQKAQSIFTYSAMSLALAAGSLTIRAVLFNTLGTTDGYY